MVVRTGGLGPNRELFPAASTTRPPRLRRNPIPQRRQRSTRQGTSRRTMLVLGPRPSLPRPRLELAAPPQPPPRIHHTPPQPAHGRRRTDTRLPADGARTPRLQ